MRFATSSSAIIGGDSNVPGAAGRCSSQKLRAAVTSEYVNHAHNDYLELVLELGAAGAVLIVLFLGWWAVAATRVWTSTLSTPFGRAATIATAAILAHSIVDYPLRTGALMAVFGAAIALMAQRSRSAPENKRSDLRPARHVKLG